ncbi:MAG: type II secretion system F family protein [Planctomycetaceae bacterium]|nr:type II secretion system F family protein [Planctomycetaceae bacterium]
MIAYQYQATTRNGEKKVGLLEADSEIIARQRLRDQGLFPLAITPQKTSRLSMPGQRVSKKDLMMVTTQLSIMHRSGLDLAESLKNVANQVHNRKLADAMKQIVNDIEDGKSFSIALQRQAHIFGDAYVAGIAAGEASGTLGRVLERLTTLLRNEVRLVGTIKSIATYPLILMFVAGGVLNALIFFVLPQFAKVFRDLDRTPPAITQILLSTGEFVRGNIPLVLGGVISVVLGFMFLIRTRQFREQLDRLMLTLPGISKATQTLLAGRTFRLIGTMVQSGVPLLDSVKLCRRSIRNSCYQKLFDSIETELTNGRKLSVALSQFRFLPSGAYEMIATSERSGDLGGVMELIGEFYEDEGERLVRDLSRMFEPAIIVVMGGVVAMVVMSVILPLLDMSSTSAY